ncbi:n-acetylglutamate synthase [Spongiivirga citrea]|uniref:N-acetylglutamate synthase n=1 Tax=Spongiivirga citrea TaxID=1481457 RepID=A0A6M0CIB4_9FLAO|nr:n-acetylglutamate synthase [Spongiivirga citrea]NER17262.1 n-acetylglutamate synthase [Spongiivirga citrea]
MINYNNKKFRPISNSDNSETDSETEFVYKQEGNIVTSTYQGNQITKGHLIGTVDKNGIIDMRYHQVNYKGELMSGICKSTPEILANGKIKLHEVWQWTSGDLSRGSSVLEEI